ncbi:MAG: hypothetical protein Q8900_01035 [Bacillota bacterium]|nr:hypothetical protein [Bacillota bacterium]
MKKILLFSRDPGGANVVTPLINVLKEKEYEVKLFGKDYALNKYKQFGYGGIDILNYLQQITLESITDFLIHESPDFIITGTSADDFTEKYLWKASEKLNIPCFAILDQWMSYGIRFSEFTLAQIEEYNFKKTHSYLPTKILVMDEYAKQQMMKEGIEDYKIEVTGQPYFDYLINKNNLICSDDILKYKKNIGCVDSDIIITFATEAITKTYDEDDKAQDHIGYTDKTILYEIYECINKISSECNKRIIIIIRLHPKDEINNYSDFISKVGNKNLQVLLDKNTDAMIAINASDIICGMSSMFLIEAAIIGKPIISVQIGLKGKNPFFLNQTGQLQTVLTKSKLENVLNDFIVNQYYASYSLNFKNGAIKKVINFMEEFI